MLHNGCTVLGNPGNSNDDLAAIGILKALGCEVLYSEGSLTIHSKGLFTGTSMEEVTVDCGESGLGIRMFTPIIAVSGRPATIIGKGSLTSRPMDFFDEILPRLGVTVASNNGKLPLTVQGPLVPNDITVDGSLSSQFLTGLLFAFAAAAQTPMEIRVTNLKSKPYIDLSLKVLSHFGFLISHQDHQVFHVLPYREVQRPDPVHYTVEGDWSGAAFLLVAGALSGEVTVKGLDVFSDQADKAILTALMDSGARISIETEQIRAASDNLQQMRPFHFNATDCPDLFPPLVALAAYCNGKSVIEGVGRLAHKESDRALTLQQEFGKLGLEITLQDDLMIIDGGKGLIGTDVHSRHDHRIAMACAVAGLAATGKTTIGSADAIGKSYPAFFDHLIALGGSVSIH